jgi:hypothetical protein
MKGMLGVIHAPGSKSLAVRLALSLGMVLGMFLVATLSHV